MKKYDFEYMIRNLPSKADGTAPDLAWVLCMPYSESQDCACVIGRDWDNMRKECGCDCHKRMKELSDIVQSAIDRARVEAYKDSQRLWEADQREHVWFNKAIDSRISAIENKGKEAR